jgi:hypothetical protein
LAQAGVHEEGMMYGLLNMLSHNGLWVMIIAVVAIGSWFKFREKELRSHEELRTKEMAHLQKMKELEIELEKARAAQSTGKPGN